MKALLDHGNTLQRVQHFTSISIRRLQVLQAKEATNHPLVDLLRQGPLTIALLYMERNKKQRCIHSESK
jgi:hypothetical protein